MSFLRKQESRLLCGCSCVSPGQAATRRDFLDCRFRGNDTLGVARHGKGVLHSAKMLPFG